MAAKDNTSASQIDKTSFFFVGLCGICHPGGGEGEFDRDGFRYYDPATQTFGYELAGMNAGQVALDGDYSVINGAGAAVPAQWNVTGTSEPDCLMCHRVDRAIDPQSGANLNWVWRAATLRGRENLVDDLGASVPAFSAAPTAGQGWFSNLVLAMTPPGKPPLAQSLQIDYSVGTANGSLVDDGQGNILISGDQITETPKDYACWACHVTADTKKRAMVWFDPNEDVHYRWLTNQNDADPANDLPPSEAKACTYCHPSGGDHNIVKGNAFLSSVQNETDYLNFRTCYECHLPGPEKHPEAPEPTGALHTAGHIAAMSCEFCHIPYLNNNADLIVDNATTGSTISYRTEAFYSPDPLNPADPDPGTRWWPNFLDKVSKDGVTRLYPNKLLLSVWLGDWDQGATPYNGTPATLADDVVFPTALWRVRQMTGGSPLAGTADDNGDGTPEVNSLAEIAAYLAAMHQADSNGVPIATTPVLVKGNMLYYEDVAQPSGVNSLVFEGTGLAAEAHHPFALDHNVKPPSEALGAGGNCGACHMGLNGGQPTSVFDRLILVNPWDETGAPHYETVRQITGVNPF